MKKIHTLAALFAATTIGACGGGGGGTPAPAPGPAPAPSPAPAFIVTDVPAPTYAAASSELLAFNRLNGDRSLCGFGKLAQNASLDQAASAHRAYLVANQTSGHEETSGLAGFTGTTPQARTTAAGYSGGVSEVVSTGIFSAPQTFGDGSRQVMGLIGLPYHSGLVVDGYRDVGFSWGGAAFVVNFGTATGAQVQTAGGVRTYPCDGSVDVAFESSNESPSPFPDQPGTTWGPAITVVGSQVRVTEATITGPLGSLAVKRIYGTGQMTDPTGICAGDRTCVIAAPAAQNTTYQVHLAGTQAGTAFTKDFSFKTYKLP
jgi:hypothetical protein